MEDSILLKCKASESSIEVPKKIRSSVQVKVSLPIKFYKDYENNKQKTQEMNTRKEKINKNKKKNVLVCNNTNKEQTQGFNENFAVRDSESDCELDSTSSINKHKPFVVHKNSIRSLFFRIIGLIFNVSEIIKDVRDSFMEIPILIENKFNEAIVLLIDIKQIVSSNKKNDIQSSIPQEKNAMDELLAKAETFSQQNKVELLRQAASEKPPDKAETKKRKHPEENSQMPHLQIAENVTTFDVPDVPVRQAKAPRKEPEIIITSQRVLRPRPYQKTTECMTTFAVPEVPASRQTETPMTAAKVRSRRASVALGAPGQATASFQPRPPVPETPQPARLMHAAPQPTPFDFMTQAMAQQQMYPITENETPYYVASQVPARETQKSTKSAKLRDRRASVALDAPVHATANFYPRQLVPETPQPARLMHAAPQPTPYDFMTQAMAQQQASSSAFQNQGRSYSICSQPTESTYTFGEHEYSGYEMRKRLGMQDQYKQTPRNYGNRFGPY